MSNLIIADDEILMVTQLAQKLNRMGYTVMGTASSGEEAVDLAKRCIPDLVLMDVAISGRIDGMTAAEIIRREMNIDSIFLTAFHPNEPIDHSGVFEPLGYILKPYHDQQIRSTIELALFKCRMDQSGPYIRNDSKPKQTLKSRYGVEVDHSPETAILKNTERREIWNKPMPRNDRILKTAMDGFWITTVKGIILEANDSVAALLGYLPHEIVGKSLVNLETRNRKSAVLPQLKKAVQKGAVRYDARLVHKNGQEIELGFRTTFFQDDKESFLFSFFHDVSIQKQMIAGYRQREVELKITAQNLREVNAALKMLIKKRDTEKVELEEKVLFNVKEMIMPYVKKLKESGMDEKQTTFVNILESNLRDILSPFSPKLTSRHFKLTPTELQIAKLVRMGVTSREMADLMGLSRRTVESHRDRIRKKVGLNHKKRNLRVFLMSLE